MFLVPTDRQTMPNVQQVFTNPLKIFCIYTNSEYQTSLCGEGGGEPRDIGSTRGKVIGCVHLSSRT